MCISEMLSVFNRMSEAWAAHDADPDGGDVEPGSSLDLATRVQKEIMRAASLTPADDIGDIKAKIAIADHMDRALDGSLTEDGEPVTAELRRSIVADLTRLRRIVLFDHLGTAA